MHLTKFIILGFKCSNKMALRRYTIIGLSGTTNSGKSTVASMLCKNLPSASSICQDTYFYEPDDQRVPIDEDGKQNWDDLGALDMNRMMRDVHSWIQRQQNSTDKCYLIIEGFLIFNYRPLASLFDKKFFFKVDKKTCAERRSKRTYNPPDYPGYFENKVWPMYLKNLSSIKDQKDIEFIDELKDLHEIYDRVQAAILEL